MGAEFSGSEEKPTPGVQGPSGATWAVMLLVPPPLPGH